MNNTSNITIEGIDTIINKLCLGDLLFTPSNIITIDLMQRIENGMIDLQPGLQRGYVWNIEQQKKFLSSFFLGFPIPSIMLFDTIYFKDMVGKKITADEFVIDGQQRLTTLYKFYKNEISINTKIIPNAGGIIDTSKKEIFYKDLVELKEAGLFKLKSLNITTLRVFHKGKFNIEEVKKIIMEIFVRLNFGGTPLTKEELENGALKWLSQI